MVYRRLEPIDRTEGLEATLRPIGPGDAATHQYGAFLCGDHTPSFRNRSTEFDGFLFGLAAATQFITDLVDILPWMRCNSSV